MPEKIIGRRLDNMDYSLLDNQLLVDFFEFWFYMAIFFAFITVAIHFLIKMFRNIF